MRLPYKPLGRAYNRGAISGFCLAFGIVAAMESYWITAGLCALALFINDAAQYRWERRETDMKVSSE